MRTFSIFRVIWPPDSPPELPVLLYPDLSCREPMQNIDLKEKHMFPSLHTWHYKICIMNFSWLDMHFDA